jgi:leucyl aminopeptidase
MLELSFITGEPPRQGVLVLLVGAGTGLSAVAAAIDAATGGLVARALAAEPGGAKHGRVIHLALPHGVAQHALVLLVAGKPEGLKPLDLEELGGTLARRLAELRITAATVASARGLDLGAAPTEVAARLAVGARLRAYRFERYRSKPANEDEPPALARLDFLVEEPGHPLPARLQAVADAVLATRDLVSEPANVLTPRAFADACAGLRELGVEVEILDRAELERLGMRALLGVAQGSAQPPYVAVMRWRGAPAAKPLVLVGKGVCFDSGGLSIKPAAGMEEMKWDMGGAAAVWGAMRAVALRKAPTDVVGLVGLVENMPSGTALRPGDVVRAMSGTTIEVVNTDAEGRLVLADVLWYAQDRFKPVAMIDLATLTGAVVVALGHEHAGLFGNDEELVARLLAAGAAVGEPLWRLPLGKAYAKHIKSDIADIKNVGRAREAGASAGAVFLERFVDGVPWAHLDIAGTAWAARDQALAGKGATAFGVRLLDHLIATHYEAAPAA